MDKRSKRRTLLLAVAPLLLMTGLVVYAPTLYRVFCNVTGFGGTVQRAVETGAPVQPHAAGANKITIFFDANVAPGLDWAFRPEQNRMEVVPGEPNEAYYLATNNSDETVVARATYNVTPFKAAPYFFKVQCFCFTEEKLGPGESAHMPLVFYVDEEMLADAETDDIHQITLSYTFFKQSDLSPAEVAQARDLSAGSKTLEENLKSRDEVGFDNDAPRR